jgi:ferredoxin
MARRLQLDPIACQAFGYCAELLPEHIALDEWGYPVLDGEPLPESTLQLARAAAGACPRRALSLAAVDGAGRRSPSGAG